MRRADEEQLSAGHGNASVAPHVALRRRSVRRAVALAVLLACVVCVSALSFFNRRAAASAASSAPMAAAVAVEPQQQEMSGLDFSKFLHSSKAHREQRTCADCHRRESNNATLPKLPGHKACTDCHLPQFVTANIPMCAICHTDLNSQKPPVKGFPTLSSFNAMFDHAQHNTGAARPPNGCVACHTPAARRAAAMTIPASFNAHGQCYSCHTSGAQANGRDISTCGVCHTPAGRFFRTSTNARAFRASFSHATHGARQRLGCADCHNLRAGLPQSRQVTAPSVSQHFNMTRAQSCMTCHNGRRAFGDANFNDCRRCHKAQTFRMGV